MPYLTLQFATGGALLDLAVGVSTPREQALQKSEMPVPLPMKVRGLIDTGASCTCIDPEIAQKLSLLPTGSTPIVTPSTGNIPVSCTQYDVKITLIHPALSRFFHVLPVVEANLASQGFHILIGRDILKECLFVYDGKSEHFSLAF